MLCFGMEKKFADVACFKDVLCREMVQDLKNGKSDDVLFSEDIKSENSWDLKTPQETMTLGEDIKIEQSIETFVPLIEIKTKATIEACEKVNNFYEGKQSPCSDATRRNVNVENLKNVEDLLDSKMVDVKDGYSFSNAPCLGVLKTEDPPSTCIPSLASFESIIEHVKEEKLSETHPIAAYQDSVKIKVENETDDCVSSADCKTTIDSVLKVETESDTSTGEVYLENIKNENFTKLFRLVNDASNAVKAENLSSSCVKLEKGTSSAIFTDRCSEMLCDATPMAPENGFSDSDVSDKTGFASRASKCVVSQTVEKFYIEGLPSKEKVEDLLESGHHSPDVDLNGEQEHKNVNILEEREINNNSIHDEGKIKSSVHMDAFPNTQEKAISLNYSTVRRSARYCNNGCSQSDNCLPDTDCEQKNESAHNSQKSLKKCSFCGKPFSRDYWLQKHIQLHVEKPLECQECGKIFASQSLLKIHARMHTNTKEKLTQCTKSSSLHRRGKTHAEKRQPYVCSTCGKAYSRKLCFLRHIKKYKLNETESNTGKRSPHKCPTCSKTYYKKLCFLRHIKTHSETESSSSCEKPHSITETESNSSSEKSHQCPKCGKVYTQRPHLLRHIRTHSGQKIHECSTCGKTFYRNSCLQIHMKRHASNNNEKHFKCVTCEKRFLTQTDLQRHTRIHTQEKPYLCSTCGKAFVQKADLDKHKRTHSGERPFRCPTCRESFSRKCVLRKHIRRHSGEKPYQCPVCSKSFTAKWTVKLHQRTHSGEKSFECFVCSKAFYQNVDLQRHLKSHEEDSD